MSIVGRKVIVSRTTSPAEVIAAGRTKTLTFNAEPIDVTSDDDEGVRTLLENDAGQKSLDMSFEGITKNADFIEAITDGQFVDDYSILITGIGTITGSFFLTSVSLTAPYNDATTFTAEFQSTGSWTFTPA